MQGARGAGCFGGSRQFDPNHTVSTGCVANTGIGVLSPRSCLRLAGGGPAGRVLSAASGPVPAAWLPPCQAGGTRRRSLGRTAGGIHRLAWGAASAVRPSIAPLRGRHTPLAGGGRGKEGMAASVVIGIPGGRRCGETFDYTVC
jgi:hypothetical protein